MRQPLPGEIVKVSNRLTRTVVNPDGSTDPQHSWLCENAWRYWQILEDEDRHNRVRFHYHGIPLKDVDAKLASRGF